MNICSNCGHKAGVHRMSGKKGHYSYSYCRRKGCKCNKFEERIKLDVHDKKCLFIAYVGCIWLAVMLQNGFKFAEMAATIIFLQIVCFINLIDFSKKKKKERKW